MNKRLQKLHSDICDLIREAESKSLNIDEQLTSWNFITDIDTNDIRPEGVSEAYELNKELKNILGK